MKQGSYTKTKRIRVDCLFCGEDIQIKEKPIIGNIVKCHDCSTLFEIIDLGPVIIDSVYDNIKENYRKDRRANNKYNHQNW